MLCLHHKTRRERTNPRRRRPRNRRGAAAIETAIVLMVFLTLVLGMLDLGLGVLRYHLLAQAARQGARQAIVHGDLANRLGTWGPAAYSGQASDDHPMTIAVRPSLTTFELSDVTVKADWLDGDNELEDRVRVTASAPYRPIMTFIFGNPSITLEGSSTMLIAH